MSEKRETRRWGTKIRVVRLSGTAKLEWEGGPGIDMAQGKLTKRSDETEKQRGERVTRE